MAQDNRDQLHQEAAGTLVVGIGVTGASVARYLARNDVAFGLVDSRDAPPDLPRVSAAFPAAPITLGAFNRQQFETSRRLIVSPGVPLAHPAIMAAARGGVEVIGDIELFAREAQAPVVAVTGSNGKTTVTTLMGQVIADQGRRVLVGGNIGTPALDLLLDGLPDYYVLELSSFQLEYTTSLAPAVAILLNVTPDHMDRYPDLASYRQAKLGIFRGAATRVFNRDDPLTEPDPAAGRTDVRFGLDAPAAGELGLRRMHGQDWLALGDDGLMPTDQLGMRGRHNVANALAVLAAGRALGLDMQGMLDTLRAFTGLPHRSQWIGRHRDVDWYDDSKGTNVGATVAALEGIECDGRIVLIAGGEGKGADFAPLAEPAARRVRTAVLIGRDAGLIAGVLRGHCELLFAGDMRDAVARAAAQARPGDAVLLSPACASFDMFRNYQHRGEVFTQAFRDEVGS